MEVPTAPARPRLWSATGRPAVTAVSEHRARSARQGIGGTRTQVCEICRRLHRHGEKRERGETGDGIANPLLRRTAATDRQPRQKPRRATEILCVPELSAQQQGQAGVDGKAHHRFKERIKEITSRNRGHNVKTVINELNLYVRGWLNYFKLSSTFGEVRGLAGWIRRRVRLYDWKQWKQPRTRRRNLLALGADPKHVHMATRSRKGYWRMSQNEIVRFALNNCWLEEQGVPDMEAIWTVLHYGRRSSKADWNRPVRSRTQGGVGPGS